MIKYTSIVMVGIVAAILGTRLSGEALFYAIFNIIQGAAFATLFQGLRRMKKAPSDAMEMRMCVSVILFLGSAFSSAWIDTDGLHPSFQWSLLGAIAGWVLSWGSNLLPLTQSSSPSVRGWFLRARVSIMLSLALYIVWVAATQPTWWAEEHFHRLRQEATVVRYDQYYRLGWHALALLAAQLVALGNNWWTVSSSPSKTR